MEVREVRAEARAGGISADCLVIVGRRWKAWQWVSLGGGGGWTGSSSRLQLQLLSNQTRVSLPDTQQSQSTDARGGEGMHRVYGRAGAKQGERAARALKTRITRWFSGKGF